MYIWTVSTALIEWRPIVPTFDNGRPSVYSLSPNHVTIKDIILPHRYVPSDQLFRRSYDHTADDGVGSDLYQRTRNDKPVRSIEDNRFFCSHGGQIHQEWQWQLCGSVALPRWIKTSRQSTPCPFASFWIRNQPLNSSMWISWQNVFPKDMQSLLNQEEKQNDHSGIFLILLYSIHANLKMFVWCLTAVLPIMMSR